MSYDSTLIGTIALPPAQRQLSDPDLFIKDVYPSHVLHRRLENPAFFQERAILCSKNVNVDGINVKVMKNEIGERATFYSADSVQSDLINTEVETCPLEYLQTLSLSGLPSTVLELKLGLPALYNGARLIIQQTRQYVLKVKIIGGSDAVEQIPRSTSSTLPGTLPFILTRK